jgi:FkbM family methyltransferase
VVLDVGGYEGNWAWQIYERYGCRVHVFEPVPRFAEMIEKRFAGKEKVRVHRWGLSDANGRATISVENDASSVHKSKGEPCTIELKSARDVFGMLGLEGGVDLIKINIEGCEYELLEHLMETGLIVKLRDIQVQFHDFVEGAAARMARIQERLAETHELSWQYRFVWENWHRKESL